jgi:hypothetical protein
VSPSKKPPIFRLFKGGDPKSFSYRPRYYDPDKERRKRVEEEAKRDRDAPGFDEEGLRERMRASWQGRTVKRETARSNLRLLIIIIILCLMVYFVFTYLDRIAA